MSDDTPRLAIPQSGGKELRLSLPRSKGHSLPNLRVWFNTGSERCAGKPGVSMSVPR